FPRCRLESKDILHLLTELIANKVDALQVCLPMDPPEDSDMERRLEDMAEKDLCGCSEIQ
ncbi:hypothetical protein SK128_021929, partial [Halocaridina rubra]